LQEELSAGNPAAGGVTENSDGNGEKVKFSAPECEQRGNTLTLIDVEASSARFQADGADLEIVSVHDASKQRQLEQELEETQRLAALGRLAGGVAHDFNNLLTAIMLYSDLLAAGLTHAGRLRHHAEEIHMAGEHGAALVRQLMAVTRPHALELRTLSLNGVISDMQGILKRLLGENIELSISLAKDLGCVHSNPSQMQQIVLNLVLNARDAMPEGGQLKLETCNRDDHLAGPGTEEHPTAWVELSVIDTGCGMDAITRAHLFEPFFTTKRPGCGSGLGLATADSIVKQVGGTIQVESEVGTGTRILVLLPRASQSLCKPEFEE